jgi:hypothetical protein
MKTNALKNRRNKATPIAHSRWLAYATAGAATALAGVPSAEADITYSGLLNIRFDAPPGGDARMNIQLDQPGNYLRPVHFLSTGGIGYAALIVRGNAPGQGVAGIFGRSITFGGSTFRYPYLSKLNFGQPISTRPFLVSNDPGPMRALGALAYNLGSGLSQWANPGTGYGGFKFDNGGGTQFGWARITMDGGPGNSFTLVDFAYGGVGDSLTAGQVPEPGSLALLAVGGVGLVAWRKRRAKAA